MSKAIGMTLNCIRGGKKRFTYRIFVRIGESRNYQHLDPPNSYATHAKACARMNQVLENINKEPPHDA